MVGGVFLAEASKASERPSPNGRTQLASVLVFAVPERTGDVRHGVVSDARTRLLSPASESGQLVRVLPRYRGGGGGIYVVWPSRKLVPARVAAARELLIEELEKFC